MKYDFTSIMDRHGKDAIAVDGLGTGFAPAAPKEGFDAIPMWVADMNFPTVPTIQEAIIERTNHPAFGYFNPTDEYFDSIIRWQAKRNGVQGLTKECIGYENGVLGGVISALNCVCSKGDKILIHSPTYIGFTMSLKNNGYEAVHSPLVKDENGVWRMDFEDMEKHLKEEKIHAAIMCNPHNPCGRVWERWELEKAMELYKKYDVYVVSDEIWSDIILSGNKHIPTQSVSEDARQRTAAFYAPSKTFNLAGLVGSYHIVYNSWWRDRMEKESSLSHYNMMNVLSMHALIGAYKPEGYEWTDELCEVLTGNGFLAAAGAAVTAEHAFAPALAHGRPNGEDRAAAAEFARKTALTLRGREHPIPVTVPGREPIGAYYTPLGLDGEPARFLKAKPKTDPEQCTRCGLCAAVCPMGSIPREEPTECTGICIKCQGCIRECPAGAKYFDDEAFLSHRAMLEQNYIRRRENEFYPPVE